MIDRLPFWMEVLQEVFRALSLVLFNSPFFIIDLDDDLNGMTVKSVDGTNLKETTNVLDDRIWFPPNLGKLEHWLSLTQYIQLETKSFFFKFWLKKISYIQIIEWDKQSRKIAGINNKDTLI